MLHTAQIVFHLNATDNYTNNNYATTMREDYRI